MKTTDEDRNYMRGEFIAEINYQNKMGHASMTGGIPTSSINSDFGVKLLDDLSTQTQRVAILEEALGFYTNTSNVFLEYCETTGETYPCETDKFEDWGTRANTALQRSKELGT